MVTDSLRGLAPDILIDNAGIYRRVKLLGVGSLRQQAGEELAIAASVCKLLMSAAAQSDRADRRVPPTY